MNTFSCSVYRNPTKATIAEFIELLKLPLVGAHLTQRFYTYKILRHLIFFKAFFKFINAKTFYNHSRSSQQSPKLRAYLKISHTCPYTSTPHRNLRNFSSVLHCAFSVCQLLIVRTSPFSISRLFPFRDRVPEY